MRLLISSSLQVSTDDSARDVAKLVIVSDREVSEAIELKWITLKINEAQDVFSVDLAFLLDGIIVSKTVVTSLTALIMEDNAAIFFFNSSADGLSVSKLPVVFPSEVFSTVWETEVVRLRLVVF